MSLADTLFPPRCVALNASGRPCAHRVTREGLSCDQCWDELSRSDQIAIRAAVAQHIETPMVQISLLAKDSIMAIRIAIAERPNLDGRIQAQLARDSEVAVLRTLAANPDLRPEIQTLLRRHTDPLVQRQLDLNATADQGTAAERYLGLEP